MSTWQTIRSNRVLIAILVTGEGRVRKIILALIISFFISTPVFAQERRQEIMTHYIDLCIEAGVPKEQRSDKMINLIKTLNKDEIEKLIKLISKAVKGKDKKTRMAMYRFFKTFCIEIMKESSTPTRKKLQKVIEQRNRVYSKIYCYRDYYQKMLWFWEFCPCDDKYKKPVCTPIKAISNPRERDRMIKLLNSFQYNTGRAKVSVSQLEEFQRQTRR